MATDNENQFFSPDDVDSNEAEAQRKRADTLKQLRDEGDLKWLMSDKRGRRVIWRLLESTGLYQSSFTGNSETFFREGRRDVGLKLLATVQDVTPDGFMLMMKERNQ
jgi:hypothetical protein